MRDTLRRGAPVLAGAAALLVAGAAAASGGEPMEPGELAGKILIHAINFVIYVGILVYFLRRPMRDFVANRRLGIKKELEDSRRMRDEARERYDEVEARIAAFDQEVEAMVAEVRRQCEVESERAEARAEETAASIARVAERTIAEETEKARHDLRRETVDLAVAMAEEALVGAVTAADQRRLADGYLEQIGEDAGA